MLRPASLLRAVLAAAPLAAALTVGVTAPSRAASAVGDDPLTVTIDALSPAVVPRRGPLTLTGTVTNTSDEQWRNLNVYALTSPTPFTTAEGLAAAVATDPATPIGERITAPGTYAEDVAETLDPGESAPFSFSVRRQDLQVSGEPGVYWLGVQALGENDTGRDLEADGRERTLVPLLDRTRRSVEAALVLSLRRPVTYEPDGRLADLDGWAEDLGPGGRLTALADLAAAAGARPLTWLVDPAVTDAVARLAAGNPPRSLRDRVRRDDAGSGDPEDSAAPDPDESDAGTAAPDATPGEGTGDGATGGAADEGEGAPQRLRRQARAWLERTTVALAGDAVLALPYGDVDVAATAEGDPQLYRLARRRSGRSIDALGLAARPVVAPPSGFMDRASLDLVQTRTAVIVGNGMLPEGQASAAVVRSGARSLVVTRSQAADGSGSATAGPLGLRQRILSEGLLRLLGRTGPLVVALPAEWEGVRGPDGAATMVAGFDDAPWLRLTTVNGLQTRRPPRIPPADLVYPPRQEAAELDLAPLASAERLIAAGRLLDSVLPLNDTLSGAVADEAFSTASYAARRDPDAARRSAELARLWIEDRLARVTVEPPRSVTLSSDTGILAADLVNGLDQTVRVRVQARTDDRLVISPTEVQELGPGERATVRMEAKASGLAVHSVQLVVASEDGRPVGATAAFPLRAGQVSRVIWVVIVVGAALLFTTIGVRLVRRIRRHLVARGAGL